VTDSRKRSGSETRKRGPIIGFRASDDERARIKAAADRAGLTVGSYVRSRALEKPTTRAVRRPPVEAAQLARLLGHLGVIGGAVTTLMEQRGNGVAVSPSDITETLTAFRQAASVIMQALGRRPHDH